MVTAKLLLVILLFTPVFNKYLGVYVKNDRIYSGVISNEGSITGHESALSLTGLDIIGPAVGYDSVNQKFLVVWGQKPLWKKKNMDPVTGLWGRLIRTTGQAIGSNFKVAVNPGINPATAFDPQTARYVVVWESELPSQIYSLYGRFLTADGLYWGDEFPLSNNVNRKQTPAITYNSNNAQYFVVWSDSRNYKGEIYGQFINSAGVVYLQDRPVSSSPTGGDIWPAVAYDSQNRQYLVVWQRKITDLQYSIRGQFVNESGNRVGNDFTLVSFTTEDDVFPSLHFDGMNNRFFLTWQHAVEGKYNIYGQVLDTAGTVLGSLINITGSTGFTEKILYTVAYNSNCGNFMVGYNGGPTSLPTYQYVFATSPVIDISPVVVDFGEIHAGTIATQTLTIRNKGCNPLEIGEVSQSYPGGAFTIVNNCLSAVEAGFTCTIEVSFAPTEVGAFESTITIPTNDPNQAEIQIEVSGTGLATMAPNIQVTNSSPSEDNLIVDFGEVLFETLKTEKVTVSNTGDMKLILRTITDTNPGVDSPFSLVADKCSAQVIEPAGSCDFYVDFESLMAGSFETDLDIPSDDPDQPNISLHLKGEALCPADHLPTQPVLVFPENEATGVGTPVEFAWKESTDPRGDTVTYDLYYCEQSDFSNCTPITGITKTAATNNALIGGGLLLALIGIWIGLKRRRKIPLFLVSLLLVVSLVKIGCDKSAAKNYDDKTVTYPVSDLSSKTQYFWKVVARVDCEATESPVWSFITK